MLPNLLHIGAAKCVSRWLWRCLKENLQVFLPDAAGNVNFALDRTARDLPGVRLMMTLREPVARVYPSWAHTYRKCGKYGLDPGVQIGLAGQQVTPDAEDVARLEDLLTRDLNHWK